LILANSGIRVGEARHLRSLDISSTKTLSGQNRLIFTVRGKTGEREVVCNETVERYVERLRNFRSEEAKTLNLEEPIFCHPTVDPSVVSRRGLNRSSMRLEFFAGPMERSASPTLSGIPTPP
jgi:hypothetical protein